ncbi:MAG: cell division protein FtsL [Lachnospiraceae bacterium]|jgi:cell division protein FtsB|nr:cell division protein FtsL [Lachnospiraceae bacterium]
MAAGRRTSAHQEYIYGNTARAIEPVRKEKNQPQRPVRRKVVSYTVRRNQEMALHMNLPYVILLTLAAFCVLVICVNYLQIQSTITARLAHIEELERNVEQLKAENDATETRINTSIDLDYIYKVATEELGMVYANRDQVLLYDKTESEYVRQYEDIPAQ